MRPITQTDSRAATDVDEFDGGRPRALQNKATPEAGIYRFFLGPLAALPRTFAAADVLNAAAASAKRGSEPGKATPG
jgi:hypothetical protein